MPYQELDDIPDYCSDRKIIEERMAAYRLMRLFLKSRNLTEGLVSWEPSMRDHALQVLLRPIKGN